MPVTIYRYGPKGVEVSDSYKLCEFDCLQESNYWLRVYAPTDEEKVHLLESIQIHPLSLEDYEEEDTRPKIERYQAYDYIVFKHVDLARAGHEVHTIEKQVNIFYYDNVVLTLHKERMPLFDKVARLIESKSDFLVRHGVDYLVNTILDVLVDSYFPVVDRIDDAIEEIEDEVEDDPRPELLEPLNDYRRALVSMRRILRPERDIVKSILKETHSFFTRDVMKYFRDIYDHLLALLDLIDSNREFVFGIRDTYRSAMDAKMNAIMKTLTVVSAIILPLSLITGIYGMNFKYMPELNHPWGYLSVLMSMVAIAVTLLLVFKKIDWL
ncbi:MAG: magnesium/cobalt transporter CorA [Promethearchaeota archaeon]